MRLAEDEDEDEDAEEHHHIVVIIIMGCFGIAGRSSNNKRITHTQNHNNHNSSKRKRDDRTRKSTQGKVNPCQDVKQEIVSANEEPEPKAVNPSADLKDDLSNTSEPEGQKARTFKFHELAAATNNFDSSCFLGEGGFGKVHKGHLKKLNQVVAIKQLDPEGVQGVREFLVEVLTLNLVDHPNLVKLIGYCAENGLRLVVYEYMPLGSLECHLHDLPPNKKGLTWNARMKIAAGAARGLEYLHCKMNPPVIYRDLKSSNILLDEGYHPKLSDFGLAKVGPVGDKTHVTTRVMGTHGYCAPDYVMTGQLTFKSDIYSFGVVLLELITGRKVIDHKKPPKEQNLVTWAKPLFKDRKKFMLMADPLLEGRYPVKSFFQAVAIAAMCLQDKPNMRPAISEVVTALDFLANQKYPQLPYSVTIHNNTTENQRESIVPLKDENETREQNKVQSSLVTLQPNV